MWELILVLLFSVSIPVWMLSQTHVEGDEERTRDPILIIPGILGTKISKNYGDNAELWPRIAALVTSPEDPFLEDLSLLKNGSEVIERPMKIGDIIRSISFGGDIHPYLMGKLSVTMSHVFDKFIYELETLGYEEGVDLFVFPYDWRLGNTQNAQHLQATLERILMETGKQKLNIVAHSMGGLLVKDYIAKYGTGLIENMFFIGTPHLGAPKAFKALMYGDDMGIKIPIKGKFTSLLNPKTVKSISQNMSSVYELIPSKKYVESGTYISKDGNALSKDDIDSLMRFSGRNEDLINDANDFHTDIDNLDIHENVYNFVGCNDSENTIGSIAIQKKKPWLAFLKESEGYDIHFVKGDETVPVRSAFLPSAENLFIKGISHGELPSADGLGTFIANLISGVSADLPASVSRDVSACDGIEGIIVSKHSPVEMHIYDENGNHTGPTESGDIEYGIPDVTYEQLEDTSYAFIPIGNIYRIENRPTEKGVFDFYAEYVDKKGNMVRKQAWNDVSIESTDSQFNISVEKDGIHSMTEVNGTDTSIVPNTSDLVGDVLSDKEPPVTKAEFLGGRVALIASDNLSGVEKTEYSLDKVSWEEYREPISIEEGQSIVFLSIDMAGNLEDKKSYSIPTKAVNEDLKKVKSGSIPESTHIVQNTINLNEPIREVPIQVRKIPAGNTEDKSVPKPKRTIKRRILVQKSNSTNTTTLESEDAKGDTGAKRFITIVWNKIKSAVYYLIWHLKTIIS